MKGRSYGHVKFQLTYLSTSDLGTKEFGVCPIYASELELELEKKKEEKKEKDKKAKRIYLPTTFN